MYYYSNQIPPQQGWICPKCGRVNAPWMPTCDCASGQITGTATNGTDVWTYKGDGKWEKVVQPQTSGLVWTEDAINNEPKSYTIWASTDEPQTERSSE